MNIDQIMSNVMTNALNNAQEQTKQWITDIIVGLNFCPFAKKELLNNTIHYHVSQHKRLKLVLAEFIEQCQYLQAHTEIETSLVIYENSFQQFEGYLDLVAYAEDLLIDAGFEGVFQIASFHPDYYFEGEDINDAANYTNRSPYPTLHLIREESMARVLKTFKNPEDIPENNIALARSKGTYFFKRVLNNVKHR